MYKDYQKQVKQKLKQSQKEMTALYEDYKQQKNQKLNLNYQNKALE
jgi:hypothetical protein